MADLHPGVVGDGGAEAVPQVVWSARQQPRTGKDPGDRRSRVERIAILLDKVVQARRPGASLRAPERLFEELEFELLAHLAEHRFLRLRVARHALLFEGSEVLPDDAHEPLLLDLLLSADVVEIVLKEGVTHEELERFAEALGRSPRGIVGADSAATLLWEADLEHIGFRCSDDFPVPHPGEPSPFDLTNRPVERADELVADESFDLTFSAASALEDFPVLDVDHLPAHLRRLLDKTAEDEARCRELRLSSADEALRRIARQLVGVQLAERDPGMRSAALDLLGRVFEILLRERRLEVARDLLRWLRTGSGQAGFDLVLQVVSERICAQSNVLLLGTVLDEPGPAKVQVAREILVALGDRAVDPLCTLLGTLESMKTRKLVCRVLAVVGSGEPATLARRAEGQPWFVARNMAYVLGRIGGARILPHLRRWVRHPDSRVRVEVARALGRVDHPGSAAILCDLLSDGDQRVRQTAVWSLAARDDPRTLSRLRQILLDDREFRSRAVEERDDFFRTYGRLADDATLDELVELLEQRQLLGRGWKAELRRGAAIALGETRSAQALRLLEKHAKSREARLRDACQRALNAMRNGMQAGSPMPAHGAGGQRLQGEMAWEADGDV
ncbi:MAG: HEAT repeat domain-containing protein [Candidatus Krumholzibacteriia bacterium]